MTKCFFDSLDEVNLKHNDYSVYRSQHGKKTVIFNGHTYVKIGTKTIANEKLSLYLLNSPASSSANVLALPAVEINPKAINEFIFNEHLPFLNNLGVAHPSLLICLLGTFCMGKTTTAKVIEENLQGIRINADQVRNILTKNSISWEKLDSYLEYCLNRLRKMSPNGLFILDKSIGPNTFKRYIPFAKMFLIRLVVPRLVVEERIRTRKHEIHDTLFFQTNLNKSWQEYTNFSENYEFDYNLDNSQNDNQVPIDLLNSIEYAMNRDLTSSEIVEYNLRKIKTMNQ